MKVIHGGNREKIAAQLGFSADEMLDFSANINPLGLSKRLLPVLTNALSQVIYYPNPEYPALKRSIADHFNVSKDDVMVGNGAVQMIFDMANAVNAQHALVLAPTFGEYERSFNRSNMTTDHYGLAQATGFELDVADLLATLKAKPQIDLICLCNPNNPTGTMVKPTEMLQIADFCRKNHKWLIIDEAFMDFVDHDQWSFVTHLSAQLPVMVLRSATKFFAIPGLRLGFAITKNLALKAAWQAQAEPWSVNTLADQFGQHMYDDQHYIEQTYDWLTREKAYLWAGLQQLPNVHAYESAANYYLLKSDVPNLREKLWQRRIMIRSCADYVGLGQDYYRVAVRAHSENTQLLAALKAICSNPVS
ncbi:threonine-phosphate decarboxylase [Lentilactobacillus fungorum]|uniref:threonine-phosphate decarboxylase n=1 Tax=Lentilactobacillus fungorum TaxID=2201250 RepID=A0ABQ3VXN9_9LACO|nr:threonine-phosphate decarboxylase CobD [Lentilactobacillus fungorum]GHP13675.1 threonine-phosphate decarboxylase [Lentilactobacillus fungorum]